MKSLNWPKMFNSNSTITSSDKDATTQNMKLLLLSEKGELVGDPYFGVSLKRYMYNQNDYVLKDILEDEIYEQLALFIPQLKFTKKDITITQDHDLVSVNIKCKNNLSFKTDLYNIELFNGGGN